MTISLKSLFVLTLLALSTVALSACSPEVGSKEWCEDMKEKPKGDWTANEAAEFTKSCIF
ncbi:DUF3012 domain-containing protein [Terasakiella sp. A23]|uniref:DUF3012 domain-containing protein n=1 Tax=Terasakiella sp. FCG-A23 TaxID=3080561 RepID=UPI002954204F|nr:DUF3012 domain-containing protein [Terasakiella sp. A23]MDV7340056.1 DUF3012 domain-containing protein [Terasakiella sp. A23]